MTRLRPRPTGEMQTRLKAPDPHAVMVPGSYDAAARTVEAFAATGAAVRRKGYDEVLVISREAVDLDRAAGGRMPFLFNHNPDHPIGNVVRVYIEGGKLVALLRFADTPEGRKAEGQVVRGELPNFSVGYSVLEYGQRSSTSRTDIEHVTRWELYEISLATIPADKAAVVRSQKGSGPMDPEDEILTQSQPTPSLTAVAPAAARAAERAERARMSTITDIGRRAGIDQTQVDMAVESGMSVEAFRERSFDSLVARQNPTRTSAVRVEMDEGDARITAMAAEVGRVLAGETAPRDPSAARYRGLSLVEMAAEMIGHRGRIPGSVGEREQILRRAFHATADFPYMMQISTNGRMAERYVAALPTYRQICRQRNVSDFRPAPHYRPGDMPALKELPEGGAISYGTFSESREYLMVAPYGRAISFSRQLLVNDQYGAIDDVLGAYSERVVAFEEQLFWTLVLSAGGAGPTLRTTGRGVFNVTDGSLAAAGAVPNTASVAEGRAAMRKRKSLDGLYVQSEPKFIVGGPDQETAIDQLLTTIIPNESANANPFAGAFKKIIAPEIEDKSWFLFADPMRVPAFVYSLLDGYTSPRLSFDEPFDSQGIKAKVEHDVGFAAVDFRGAYRNPGL